MKNKQEEEKKLNDFTPEIYERLNMLEGKLKDMKTQKKVSGNCCSTTSRIPTSYSTKTG